MIHASHYLQSDRKKKPISASVTMQLEVHVKTDERGYRLKDWYFQLLLI